MPTEPSPYHRYRAVLLAALDFKIAHQTGQFVCDGYDGMKEYFLSQKRKTEAETNLDQLQQQLAELAEHTRPIQEASLIEYVKEKTGLDLESFEEWQNREQARAESRKKQEQIETRTETKLLYEKDGVRHMQVRVSSGPKPDHHEEQEAVSPDGRLRLRTVQWAKGDNASTYVTLLFPTANGPIYGIQRIQTQVNAYWQDNATIVIETPKEYKPYVRHFEVRSGDDKISIKYIEY